MASLPYVTAPGSIDRALKAMKDAATPERVSQDFVKTILKVGGGSGTQIASYLKKIGFANADGTPSDLYRKYRNPTTAGAAVAEAIKLGYAPLYKRNEYMHKLSDEDLRGLIVEETGLERDSSVVGMVFQCVRTLKKHATWDGLGEKQTEEKTGDLHKPPAIPTQFQNAARAGVDMNLSYTINLNLPATSDIAVFNAIFKSLKENLLRIADE